MPMVPFQLDVEIRAPLAGGDIPTLDAVMLGEIVRTNPDAPDYAAGPDAAMKALKPLLKIAEGGIPHASALLFDAPMAFGSISKAMRVRREFEEIAPRDLQLPEGRREWSSITGRRETPQLFNGVQCRLVGRARFVGVGDIGEIRRVLSFWQGVGAQWRNGWGALADHPRPPYKKWRIRPVNEDPGTWGLIDGEKNPVRPLPLDLFRSLGGNPAVETVHARARPPYWSAKTKAEKCVFPGAKTGGGKKARKADQEAAEFLFNRFARFMHPHPGPKNSERKIVLDALKRLRAGVEISPNEKAAIVRGALRDAHPPERGSGRPQRLVGAALLATPSMTRLAANARPRDSSDRDASFQMLPTSEVANLLADALEEKSPVFAVVEFRREGSARLENIRLSYGESGRMFLNTTVKDNSSKAKMALSGRMGTVDRAAVRRLLELEESLKPSASVRSQLDEGKNPLVADPGISDDPQLAEWCRLKFNLTPAEKRMMGALRKIRKPAAKKKRKA